MMMKIAVDLTDAYLLTLTYHAYHANLKIPVFYLFSVYPAEEFCFLNRLVCTAIETYFAFSQPEH